MSKDPELQKLKDELAGKTKPLTKAKKALIYGTAIVGGGIICAVIGHEVAEIILSKMYKITSSPSEDLFYSLPKRIYVATRSVGYGTLPGEILGNIAGYFGARRYIKRKENLG